MNHSIGFIDSTVLNIITLPREPKGATSASGLLLRRELVPMVTYSDLFTFIYFIIFINFIILYFL